jgi:hypothetical protein
LTSESTGVSDLQSSTQNIVSSTLQESSPVSNTQSSVGQERSTVVSSTLQESSSTLAPGVSSTLNPESTVSLYPEQTTENVQSTVSEIASSQNPSSASTGQSIDFSTASRNVQESSTVSNPAQTTLEVTDESSIFTTNEAVTQTEAASQSTPER